MLPPNPMSPLELQSLTCISCTHYLGVRGKMLPYLEETLVVAPAPQDTVAAILTPLYLVVPAAHKTGLLVFMCDTIRSLFIKLTEGLNFQALCHLLACTLNVTHLTCVKTPLLAVFRLDLFNLCFVRLYCSRLHLDGSGREEKAFCTQHSTALPPKSDPCTSSVAQCLQGSQALESEPPLHRESHDADVAATLVFRVSRVGSEIPVISLACRLQ